MPAFIKRTHNDATHYLHNDRGSELYDDKYSWVTDREQASSFGRLMAGMLPGIGQKHAPSVFPADAIYEVEEITRAEALRIDPGCAKPGEPQAHLG